MPDEQISFNLRGVIQPDINILYYGFLNRRQSDHTLRLHHSVLLIFITAGFLAVPVLADDRSERAQDFFQRGEKAYYNREYKEAVDWYERGIELGHLESMKSVALMYATGRGVKQDRKKADRLYKKMLPDLRTAASGGDISAMRTLAYMLENGLGVPQRQSAALGWYKQAAKKGDVASMRTLSTIYDLGVYVPRDVNEAIGWLVQAADHGDAVSMYELGQRYERGNGVAQSRDDAIHWYQTAASFGENDAQNALRRLGQRPSYQLKLYTAGGDKQFVFIRYQGASIDLECFNLKQDCIALDAITRARAGEYEVPKAGRGSPVYLVCSIAGGRWSILRDAQRKEYYLCTFVDKTMVEAQDLYQATQLARQ
ncbi:MAG: hypothetical protein AMJ68_06635 [Acidithiobacillales bacterium SG8_45]|nr:MAG: hypothetical protein AMJ68_06635 [Acidithiobacillales bacterium SG8_45]